jgi:hypothetical protein
MKEELYYLVPKELMDKLMGELGSYAYINNCFTEMNGLNQQLTNTPLIDLSDEAIEERAEDYVNNYYNRDMKSFYNVEEILTIKHYSKALTDLKQKL